MPELTPEEREIIWPAKKDEPSTIFCGETEHGSFCWEPERETWEELTARKGWKKSPETG